MLDMLHYFFETDALVDEEVQKAKLKMRRTIYKTLYVRDYTWLENMSDGGQYREFGVQEASGVGGQAMTHKPYIPPTPVNANAALPFGNVLDAPLG